MFYKAEGLNYCFFQLVYIVVYWKKIVIFKDPAFTKSYIFKACNINKEQNKLL